MLRLEYISALALLVLLPLEAQAAPGDLYDAALDRIERNYLWWDELEIEVVLQAVGEQLQRDVEWALVDVEGNTLRMFHGDGQLLGEITVEDWDELDDRLRELETYLMSAGETLDDDQDPRIILLDGVADALDRHSRILHGERLEAFDKRLKGTVFGIGARIGTNDDHQIVVEAVYEGTPAMRGGLLAGDIVLRVDGLSSVGMGVRNAVNRITGPEGTPVELLLERDLDDQTVELLVSLVRAEVRIPNLSSRRLADGIGYIEIEHFSEQTVKNLEAALAELGEQGALDRGLVLDLRHNTGGSMMQSAQTADHFVTEGGLVRTVGRDGEAVRGLVSSIDALEDGAEPDVPLVILVDSRTASGSEIVAGALRELDRAILLGTNTYGKGTVQKRYGLSSDTALKLTVARFLLEGDISISDLGLEPDLAVGRWVFSDNGVRRLVPRLPDDSELEPLYTVAEEEGWREGAGKLEREDPLIDIAVRILELDPEPGRSPLLSALASVEDEVRHEEDALLREAYAARSIDWSRAPTPPLLPAQVRIDLSSLTTPRSGGETTLMVRVTNLGAEPLHRVSVKLDSDDRVWRGLVLPVGRIEPGQAGQGTVKVQVPAGRPARESEVRLTLENDGGDPVALDATLLGYSGDSKPDLDLRITLRKDADAHLARIELRQDGTSALDDVRVRFEYPESAAIELTAYDTGLVTLDPGVWEAVELGLIIDGSSLAFLPLHVIVESEPYGELVDWPMQLPVDGTAVDLRGPSVTAVNVPLSIPTGDQRLSFRANDDRRIDHVVVWGRGEKLAYASGLQSELQVEVSVDIVDGDNRFTVTAEDDQGLVTRRTWYVRGVAEVATTDAED